MKELLFSTILLVSIFAYSQKSNETEYWKNTSEKSITSVGERKITPDKFTIINVDFNKLKKELDKAPLGYNSKERFDFLLPTPIGNQNYKIVETPVLSEEIQKTRPDIKTFTGFNSDLPNEWIKIDYTS